MKIKPLFDRVLVLPNKKEESESGILIPQNAQDSPIFGRVVAVGDGENLDLDKTGMKVEVGNLVMFQRHCGCEVEVDGVKHILIRQVDLLGVVCE